MELGFEFHQSWRRWKASKKKIKPDKMMNEGRLQKSRRSIEFNATRQRDTVALLFSLITANRSDERRTFCRR